jgi:hypothetical protein
MKVKLLKLVQCSAIFCAHINGVQCTDDVQTGCTIGYGSEKDYEYYTGIWQFDMTEEEFNRTILQKYWELHKNEYKYRCKNRR